MYAVAHTCMQVSARVHEAGQMAAVTIADTGIGIPRHKLDVIFHPFEQVDKATTRKYGGCGLGLNIVQVRAVQIFALLGETCSHT